MFQKLIRRLLLEINFAHGPVPNRRTNAAFSNRRCGPLSSRSRGSRYLSSLLHVPAACTSLSSPLFSYTLHSGCSSSQRSSLSLSLSLVPFHRGLPGRSRLSRIAVYSARPAFSLEIILPWSENVARIAKVRNMAFPRRHKRKNRRGQAAGGCGERRETRRDETRRDETSATTRAAEENEPNERKRIGESSKLPAYALRLTPRLRQSALSNRLAAVSRQQSNLSRNSSHKEKRSLLCF